MGRAVAAEQPVTAPGTASGTASGVTSGASATSRLVDVHHHLFPPAMVDVLRGKLPDFSLPGVDRSLHAMDADGTATALISFPNSDIAELDEQRLASLIRSSNEYA